MLRGAFYAAALMLLLCLSAMAEELACAGVTPDAGRSGYQLRTDDTRCEGLYRSPVAGVPLELLSLTIAPLDYQLRPDATLYVTGSPAGRFDGEQIRLQARALPLSTYYRMDALMYSERSFKWPMAVLNENKLKPDLIGVIGWIDRRGVKTYVPILVSERNLPWSETGSWSVILRSVIDVEKIFWRRWPANRNRNAGPWQSVAAFHRAGEAIRVQVPANDKPEAFEFSVKTVGSDEWASVIAQVIQP